LADAWVPRFGYAWRLQAEPTSTNHWAPAAPPTSPFQGTMALFSGFARFQGSFATTGSTNYTNMDH
jgi:hypothetical protein